MVKTEEKTSSQAMQTLEESVYAALETYSNVHRGSGHKSMVSTTLFEQARAIVLDYLKLDKSKYKLIFCSPRAANKLSTRLEPGSYEMVSSAEIGLAIGLRALAIKKKSLPNGIPWQTGGGTTKLMSQNWVIWADAPERFEAGTPAIINILAFAKALLLSRQYGAQLFQDPGQETMTVNEILHNDSLQQHKGMDLLNAFKKSLIGHGFQVPTTQGSKAYVNLDNSASTPTFEPIWDAYRKSWRQPLHRQHNLITEVRSICSKFLGAPTADYDLFFTSNTTEAINLAAEGLKFGTNNHADSVVVNSLLEHSSNDLPWRIATQNSVLRLSIDDDGFVSTAELEDLLSAYNLHEKHGKKRIRLVAINGASNVLGICNNISEISRIAHKYKANLLVDAAQLAAHRKIDMEAEGIDFLAFSAHKVYAPFGSGALVARKGLLGFNDNEIDEIKASGEENVAGIAALGKALIILQRIGMDLILKEEQLLTSYALDKLKQMDEVQVYGLQNSDSPNFYRKLGVIPFNLKNMMADKVALALATHGAIGVRNGCLCAHILVKHILKIGPGLENFQRLIQTAFPKVKLPGLVRISFGIENSESDIDNLIETLALILNKKKGAKSKIERKGHHISTDAVKKQMKEMVKHATERVFLAEV